MNKPIAMDFAHDDGNFPNETDSIPNAELFLLREQFVERLTRYCFHRQIVEAVNFPRLKHPTHARMPHHFSGFGFPLKTLKSFRSFEMDLQSYVLLLFRIPSLVDFSACARPSKFSIR